MNSPETKPLNDVVEEQTVNQLLESLLHSITLTQSFKSKWTLISSNLSILKSLLIILPPSPLSNPLIRSLCVTLSHALSLSLECHSLNPPLGKLQTQNQLHSISASLSNHLHDLHILVSVPTEEVSVGTKSIATDSVTTVTGFVAIKQSVKTLITRLQIGSVCSKISALDQMLKILDAHDKNVIIAVSHGLVPVLVKLLDSGNNSSQELIMKSVAAIARVSSIESNKHALIDEGLMLLHNLIRVLESGNGFAKEKSCVVLQALTSSKENAIVIVSRGGVSSLLGICSSSTPAAQACAAGVLRNLSKFLDTRESFLEENAVSVLLTLASSGTVLAQEHSISCLSNMAREDDDMKLLIVQKGGIVSLKNFWDNSALASRSLEVAVEFLSNLVSDQRLVEFIISNGFLNRLKIALSCGVLAVRIHAAEAVYKIGYNAETHKELGELGFISRLISMLDAKSVEEIETSAKALSTILVCTENRKIYKKDQRGIVSVVRLLDSLVTNLDKKYPVSILMSLVHSKKCRKQMVNSGALLHLQKLVVMDVEGAKKLQEIIGGGKILGVFRRP
uniref:uncharacterized protein LOC122608778 n=1 Tax=Erigeron canadensis TaxID=72917 RepID=UPI001CB949A5|nr:uncharacterized protein LOC122608778 [Erigeron canadensis]